MSTSEVLVEREGEILIITINRPQRRNAINRAVTDGVAAAVDELDGSDELTLGILTGAGGTFSSGLDLNAFLAGEKVSLPGRGLAGICRTPPRKPLIAAVEGWALAGGFEIALACDLIVAADDAKFGIPEVKRGLVAGAGGLLRLPRRIPPAVAMEIALTGDHLTAETAHRHGLVNVLTTGGGALAAAVELGRRIAANGPLAVAATKQILSAAQEWTLAEGFERQGPIMDPVFASADAKEGARAFAEKRRPEWTGH